MFEKFVETINNTGKVVGEKAKQGGDIAKANIKLASEERALADIYTEIGKLYFEKNRENPCCDEMKELFDKAEEKNDSVEMLKNQLRVLKGVNVCANCGADVPLEFDFCGKCGAKVEKPEPAPEEAEVSDNEVTEEPEAAPEEPISLEKDGE